jgi:SPW repeat
MRLINTKVHAALDYLLGILLAGAPWIFRFEPSGPKYNVPLAVGSMAACLALVTKFEYAPIKLVPLRLHLIIDVVSGIALAASPWVFGFSDIVFKPHLVFGLTHAVVALLTDRMLYEKVKHIKTRTDSDGNIKTD